MNLKCYEFKRLYSIRHNTHCALLLVGALLNIVY